MKRIAAAVAALAALAAPVAAQAPSDDAQVRAVVKQLFDGMRAGDSAMVRATFAEGAQMATAMMRNGEPVWRWDPNAVDGFAKAVGTPHDQVWDEKLWEIDVMIDNNLDMYRITVGEHPDYFIPYFKFRGTPVGIDIFKVVETGITPVIDGGLGGKDGGQIGAGVIRAPMECFEMAVEAYEQAYG